jgi:hypothetical protein
MGGFHLPLRQAGLAEEAKKNWMQNKTRRSDLTSTGLLMGALSQATTPAKTILAPETGHL